jgi:2-aminoadipate transaminase
MSPYDFATGNTNPEAFPEQALSEAAQAAIPEIARDLNIYPGKLGHPGLRRLMAERERDREGVTIDPEHIALTNGSMQAVTLIAEALCQPGDTVVMEAFNYPGTINAYRTLGIDMVGVPVDGHGMRIDELERVMERLHKEGRAPKFIYTLATYQNPTGFTMPRARREELLAVARRYDTIVVEDNCYGDVHFEGDKPPALYALDDSPNQIYTCSLSKIFAPGVRLGYLYARPPMLERLLARRHDAGPNTLASAIMYHYLDGNLWAHCERANAALKKKRDVMLEALEAHLGNACSWSHPVGGLFIWVRLPEDLDLDALEAAASEREVYYMPGANFELDNQSVPYLRLAFGFPSVENIHEGVRRLGESITAARSS